MQFKNKKIKVVLVSILSLFLVSYFVFLFTDKINLQTADLGRHIQNGSEIISGNYNVLKTNFYSYTNQDFPFINHHWGTGVLFYFLHSLGGFELLSMFYVLLGLLTFSIFFFLGLRKAGFFMTFITSLFVLPLIASRTEVRPELISYFLISTFILFLYLFKKNKMDFKYIFLLLPMQFLWVTLHIYFIFGVFLTGLFFTNELLAYLKYTNKKILNNFYFYLEKFLFFSNDTKEKILSNIKNLSILLISLVGISIINPWGLKGLLYPFNIMDNFGYRLVENQSVWFLENLNFYQNPNIEFFEVVFGISLLSFILIFLKREKVSFINIALFGAFSFLAFSAMRNFTIFAFISIIIISSNFFSIKKIYFKKLNLKNKRNFLIPIFLILFIFFIQIKIYDNTIFNTSNKGIGLIENSNSSAQFFKEQNIKGPIFNNYDIGGFLIYNLYPEYKVFVDNRPEAYKEGFLQETYVKMQENEFVWKEKQKEYSLNSIFFYRHDMTPWSQEFLVRRVEDNNWTPVYFDNYAIIFVKNIEKNKELIEKFEIFKHLFSIKKQ